VAPSCSWRAYATFKKRWPDKEILVTPPQIDFYDYPTREITQEDVVHIMVGDLQRILLYPARGFQIEQVVPESVRAAYERLVALGYTRHMINA
jgi:uncharacterized SAM-binding protein YcdF (DUF218 family)